MLKSQSLNKFLNIKIEEYSILEWRAPEKRSKIDSKSIIMLNKSGLSLEF